MHFQFVDLRCRTTWKWYFLLLLPFAVNDFDIFTVISFALRFPVSNAWQKAPKVDASVCERAFVSLTAFDIHVASTSFQSRCT